MAVVVADIKAQITLRKAEILAKQGTENIRTEELERLEAWIAEGETE